MSNDGYVDVHLEYSSEVFELEPFADGSLSHEELFELIRRPVLALIFSSETRRRLIVPKQGVFSKPPNGWFGGTITAVVTMPVVFEPPSRPGSQIADQKPFLDTVLGKRAHPTPEDSGPVPAKVAITNDHCGTDGGSAALPHPPSSSTTQSQPSLPVKPSNSRQFSFSAPVVRYFAPSEVTNLHNGTRQAEDVPLQSVSTMPSRLAPANGAERAVSTVAHVAPHAVDAVSDNSINTNASVVDEGPSTVITKVSQTSSSSSSAEIPKDVSTTSLIPIPASIKASSKKTSTAPATTTVDTPASKPNTDDDDDVVILKVVIKKKSASARAVSSSTSTSSTLPVKAEPIISETAVTPVSCSDVIPPSVDPWLSAYSVPTFEDLYKLPEFKYDKKKCGLSKSKSFCYVRDYIIHSFVNCVLEFKAKGWSIHTFCIFRRGVTKERVYAAWALHRPLEEYEMHFLTRFRRFEKLVLMTPPLVEAMDVLLKNLKSM